MRNLFSKMWNDDAGIVAFEYLLVATILGLALVVGLSAVSAAINAEMVELAQAILSLNQSYSVGSQSVCSLATYTGSTAVDAAQGSIGYGHSAATAAAPYTGSVGVDVCP
jgi:Flp pilus assembly pilin Flp